MLQVLFSLDGRINRLRFWLYNLIPVLTWVVMLLVIGGASEGSSESIQTTLKAILFVIWVLCVWIALAIHVKRWHDLDRSGWLALLVLVPYLGTVVSVVIGFIAGTSGSNRFGDDPLQKVETDNENGPAV